MSGWSNHDALHRHATHAYEDFRSLRKLLTTGSDAEAEALWHSMSHHLRHAVFRSGLEVAPHKLRTPVVRRRFHW